LAQQAHGIKLTLYLTLLDAGRLAQLADSELINAKSAIFGIENSNRKQNFLRNHWKVNYMYLFIRKLKYRNIVGAQEK
jgi:hypothetical protein